MTLNICSTSAVLDEPITLAPHWGDHIRDAFWGTWKLTRLQTAFVAFAGLVLGCGVVAAMM